MMLLHIININWTRTNFKIWINNYIYMKLSDVISHPYFDFNDGFNMGEKLHPMENYELQLLIHDLNTILLDSISPSK